MQGNSWIRAALWAALIVSGLAAGQAAGQPTVDVRQVISTGPWNKPVNETAISQIPHNFPANKFVAMWQVEEAPSGGSIERSYAIFTATGTYDPGTGNLAWSAPFTGDLPIPGNPDDYDGIRNPTVVATHDSPNWYFIAGAEAYTSTSDTFVVPSDNQHTEFDDGDTLTFTQGITQYCRLGVHHNGAGLDEVQMLAQNIDPNAGEENQIFLRRRIGTGYGDWTTTWEALEIGTTPIVGFPSAPGVMPLGDESAIHTVFAYADDQATFLRTAYRASAAGGDFLAGGLDIDPVINVGSGQTYFERSNEAIVGDFGIRPFTQIAVVNPKHIYMVYHDFDDESVGDGNFDVWIVRGQFSGGSWSWSNRYRINTNDSNVQHDQFMPVIVAETTGQNRLHIAWYDTRHDAHDPDDDGDIALYYARLRDANDDGDFSDSGDEHIELLVDEDAIRTSELTNPKFIGDRIDIAVTPDLAKTIIVYMGTYHQPGHPHPTDETIFSYEIEQ
jgi:hypothetical protein